MKLKTQTFGAQADWEISAAASDPFAQIVWVGSFFSQLKEKYHSLPVSAAPTRVPTTAVSVQMLSLQHLVVLLVTVMYLGNLF